MKTLIGSTLLFLSGLVCVQAGEKDSDLDRMQGTWIVVSLVEEGKAVPAKETEILEYVISKDVFTVYEKGKIVVQDQIKLDPTKTPKTIDFTHLVGDDKGKSELAIYVFEKDQLKLCINEKAKERPTVFDGKETQSYSVLVLKKKEK
jgi:uncharacterized protein (TIGR03067 family)